MSDDLKFSVMCSLFSWIQRSKTAKLKRSKFRKFLDRLCKPADYFSAIRLLLPSLDRERGSYGFKESALATSLVEALGMSRDSPDALRLTNWRKGGAKTGANAGNFPNVAAEVLQRRQGMASGGLTVKELNDLLDRLASSDKAGKISILGDLIRKTNSQEMKWIIMIILKELKLGLSEKSIFNEFHPEAEDLFNVTCDLRLVCEKLCDKNQRHKRQDIDVGKPVRPQLALRVDSAAAAWKKLHGKEVVVECKFDGHRMQVHKNGSDIHFFTRNFHDRDKYRGSMSSIVIQNILVDRCILDGELAIWEKSTNRFVEFGAHEEEAMAARDGVESDHQFCYIAFDILYYGDTSVIHRSLKERHVLLQEVVRPLKYRFEILVPDGGLNTNQPSGEPRWSLVAHSLSDVEKFFKETIDNRDEGIVLKDLGSKWDPSDRSGKWLKLKPDYIHAGSDLDVLIIGGYYGSGRNGGEVAQFLVGLAEKSAPNAYPRRFISFCRVGTGLSDDELKELVSKLKPYFRKYEYPKKAAPSFYHVTNSARERPDVWIESPEKSVILSITSDIRTMSSEVFAAPYNLRFPRIDKVRYDKPWHECLDVQSFVELVQSSNGTTQRTGINEGLQDEKPKRRKASKRGDKNKISLVPSHFIQTDVSTVKGETSIFSDMVFYFFNVPPNYSLDSLHKMVIENGGTFSMNLSNAVTHCIAFESKGIKYEAAKRHGDVIHSSWFLECCSQNKLIHLQPKYFLFLSDSLRKKLRDEIDEFSDSYFWDLNVHELKQILGSVKESEDARKIDHYKKKHCPSNKWSRFHGCCMYFHNIVTFHSKDWRELLGLSARRMKAEVSVGGGTVSENLSQATHLVVLLAPGYEADSQSLLESFSLQEKRLLYKKKLFIVRSQWLEDCLNQDHKLSEAPYSLKLDVLGEAAVGSDQDKAETDVSTSPVHEEKPPSPVPATEDQQALAPIRGLGRKRGRPQAATRTKKGAINQPRRTRPRVAHRPTKICADESENDKTGDEVDTESSRDPKFHASTCVEEKPTKTKEVDMVEDLDFPGKNKGGQAHEQSDESRGQSRREDGADTGERSMLNAQKLGAVMNPMEAMLLDIIPGLRVKQGDTSSPVQKDEKAPTVTKSEPLAEPKPNPNVDPASVKEKDPMDMKAEPPVDPNPGPAKKKKVSYKDMASELLKDW